MSSLKFICHRGRLMSDSRPLAFASFGSTCTHFFLGPLIRPLSPS